MIRLRTFYIFRFSRSYCVEASTPCPGRHLPKILNTGCNILCLETKLSGTLTHAHAIFAPKSNEMSSKTKIIIFFSNQRCPFEMYILQRILSRDTKKMFGVFTTRFSISYDTKLLLMESLTVNGVCIFHRD